MDQLITKIIAGELNAVSLLMLFIIGILTKRFVPWWVHEEVVKKLEEYEQASPQLITAVKQLIDAANDPERIEKIEVDAPYASEIYVNYKDTEEEKKPTTRRVRRYGSSHGGRR